MIWLTLISVVASAAPFHCTIAPEIKPTPSTVSVKPLTPTAIRTGLIVSISSGALMMKFCGCEVAPLLVTVMEAEPAEAMRPGGTVACN